MSMSNLSSRATSPISVITDISSNDNAAADDFNPYAYVQHTVVPTFIRRPNPHYPSMLQVTHTHGTHGTSRVVVLGQYHIFVSPEEEREPWYIRERCVCGRLFYRMEDDWSRHRYCGRHPINYYDELDELFDVQAGKEEDLYSICQDFITRLGVMANIGSVDTILREAEGLVLLWMNIMECSTTAGIFSSVCLYIRSMVKGSFSNAIVDFIREIVEEPVKQSGEEENIGWADFLEKTKTHWAQCRNNGFFNHFSRLLGVLVVFGVCNASKLTFSVGAYKLFEPDILSKHKDAPSLVDAIFSTIVYFTERMVACFKDKSLAPLFAPDNANIDLDTEFSFILSAWSALKSGNLTKVHKISEHEFDQRLTNLTRKLRDHATCLRGFDKKVLTDKLTVLAQVQNDFVTHKVHSGLRRSPFTIEVHGLSSQGKTTFASQLVDCMLASAGLPTDAKYRATHNASDRYWSSWSSDKLVLTVDDFANEKVEMMDTAPGRVLIDVCNNTPFYATKADLESKGKAFVEPEIVVVTTNVKDLCAFQLSNCPYSLQRRPHVVIHVTAKSEYQYEGGAGNQGIDSAKVRRANFKTPTDDIWTLSVEKAVQPESLQHVADYELLEDSEGDLFEVDFARVARYVITQFHAHREHQADLIFNMTKRSSGIPICLNCTMPAHICICPESKVIDIPQEDEDEVEIEFEHVITGETRFFTMQDKFEYMSGNWVPVPETEQQTGFESFQAAYSGAQLSWRSLFMSPRDMWGTAQNLLSSSIDGNASRMAQVATFTALSSARYFYKWFDWLQFVPTPFMRKTWVQQLLIGAHSREMHKRFVRDFCVTGACALGLAGISCFTGISQYLPIKTMIGSTWLFANAGRYKHMRYHTWLDLVERQTINPTLARVRDALAGSALRASTVLVTLFFISRAYSLTRKTDEPQTMLEPTDIAELAERDATENPWVSVVKRKLTAPEACKTTTLSQLDAQVRKNLHYATVVRGDDKYRVNVLFLRSNVILLPKHYFMYGDELKLELRNDNPNSLGGVLHTTISKNRTSFVEGQDIAIAYIACGGSKKDLVPWLTEEVPACTEIFLQWRDREGEVKEASGTSTAQMVSHGEKFYGGRYNNLTMATFTGLCGAIITTPQGGTKIYGMHVGGVTGASRGCCAFLPASVIKDAICRLEDKPGVVLSGNLGEFDKQTEAILSSYDRPLPAKNCLRHLPEGSQIQYHGHNGACTTSYTSVRVMPTSEHVMDILNSPNIYCPPKMKPEWFGWQKCLANLSLPGRDLPVDLLERSIIEYIEPLMQLCKSDMWKDTEPLEYFDNICGVPGRKFLDPIKLDTAVGIPYKGIKRDYVIEMEPTVEHPNLHGFNDEINNEIDRLENLYKRGLRGNTIAKACKKDEVLAKADKCRIFYSNPVALTFLVRKYYLPILRIIQMHPLTSECAVGINSHSLEWHEFQQHALHFGRDNIIGGDYSKYDQKLPAQLLFASLWVLIEMARHCKYSVEDIIIMRAMTADIVFAYIHFDGNLISLTEGGHISGNSLTVILNGICGSLNVRCAFYERLDGNFREHVKLMTYGDDNIGSASSQSKFTIKTISEFLGRYGQEYTMPDKESDILDYLPYEDFEFLKRRNTFCPKRGYYTGALIEKSIHKMLHCYMRPKGCELSPEMASAINVDTAMREWFHHGETIYEERRKQLAEISERAGITHLTTQLTVPYDSCVESWRSQYLNTPVRNMGEQFVKVEDSRTYMDTILEYALLA